MPRRFARKKFNRRNNKKAISKVVKRVMLSNMETKHQISSGSGTLSPVWTIIGLPAIAAGTNSIDRIGNAVYLKNLSVNFRFGKATAAASSVPVRVMIVYAHQIILDADLPSTPNAMALYDKFIVIRDWRTVVNSVAPGDVRLKKFHVKCNRKQEYVGVSSTDQDWGRGQYFLCFQSETSIALPTYEYTYRVTYKDI